MTARNDTPRGRAPDAQPHLIPSGQHRIARQSISDNATKVLRRLQGAGYQSFLVGGGVRDLLLGREPKDFDVATNARPEQIRELFRSCLLIGRRFRLAHVRFGREIIEVSTFRAAHRIEDSDARCDEGGRILRDNRYGTIDEDVWRRDFTVNALFYNINDHSVVDYVGGVRDLQDGQLRLIGDPQQRYVEDPVRLLRAVRFAVKLGFRIHPESEGAIPELSYLLTDISPARLFEEMLKLFMGGMALQTFETLRHYGLFRHLFPQTEAALAEEEGGFPHMFVSQALRNTDLRLAEGKPVTPGFLISALLWTPVLNLKREYLSNGLNEHDALSDAVGTVLSRQIPALSIPRRFNNMIRKIWHLQYHLERRKQKDQAMMEEAPYFRAAYDFLQLRQQSGEELSEVLEHWEDSYRAAAANTRHARRGEHGHPAARHRSGRRRHRPRPDR